MPLPTVVIQAPKDATYNLLLGVDFLNRFHEYCSNHSQISFLTPCGHWIRSKLFLILKCEPPLRSIHAASMVVTPIQNAQNGPKIGPKARPN